MKTFKVEVTQDDINDGLVICAFACPLAIALSRALNIRTGISHLCITTDKIPFPGFPTPEVLKDFMAKFDKGYKVEPFTFELEVPE